MTTEQAEFRGWTWDGVSARAFAPTRLRRHGKRLFFGCFWFLAAAKSVELFAGALFPQVCVSLLPRWLAMWGVGGLGTGIALGWAAEALRNRSAPTCSLCGKPMAVIDTLPSPEECLARGYRLGASGHAYAEDGQHTREIRKRWYGCRACRRYFLFDDKVMMPVAGMEEQERDIARAARAIRGAIARQKRRISCGRGRQRERC